MAVYRIHVQKDSGMYCASVYNGAGPYDKTLLAYARCFYFGEGQ